MIKQLFIIKWAMLLCVASPGLAQTFTLKQVIDTTLKNNLGITIIKNEKEIAQNNNTIGAAGMLPSVGVNATTVLSRVGIRQELANGNKIEQDGVGTQNINSSVQLSWVLFDGFGMFATKERLSIIEELGEIRLKQTIQDAIAEVSVAFFELEKQIAMLSYLDTLITIAEERLKLAELRTQIGKTSELDKIQANLELNNFKSQRIRQHTQVKNATVSLNKLMMRPPQKPIEPARENVPQLSDELSSIISKINSGNLSLKALENMRKTNELENKEIKSQLYPRLQFSAAYGFNRNQNQQGFFLLNQNSGPNAGFGLTWNLFNAGAINRQMKNQQLVLLNRKLELDDTRNELLSMAHAYYNQYQTSTSLLLLEQQNEILVAQNLSIQQQRYRLGEGTMLELKDAQRMYEEHRKNIIDIRYEIFQSHLYLMLLTGQMNY
jgi:outer membrane protein